MLELKGIEAIVFDLGGVIIDIDFQRSFDVFSHLSGKSSHQIKQGLLDSGLLHRYEKGEFSDEEFLELVKETFRISCDHAEIKEAFLALLMNIPLARVDLLRSLAKTHRLFLLSNTSAIHYREVNQILKRDTSVEHLDQLFEKVFLSYELKLLKPGKEIYRAVLNTIDIDASKVLFVDDNADNIKGAASLGIRTAHVSPQASVLDLFNPSDK